DKGEPQLNAITNELIATAGSEGLAFAAMMHYARTVGNPALRKMTCLRSGLLITFIFTALSLVAQVKTGEKAFEKKQWDKAKTAFDKALQDPEEQVAAHFWLAKLHSTEAFSGKDFTSAGEHIAEAEAMFQKSFPTKKQDLAKDNITQSAIITLRNRIATAEWKLLRKEPDTERLEAFIDRYPKLPGSIGKKPKLMLDSLQNLQPKPPPVEEFVRGNQPASSDLNWAPKSLGTKVNTGGMEHLPVLSADGQRLYFCGNNRTDNEQEDVYVVEKINGEWGEAKRVTELCTWENDAPLSLTADGNRMIFFRNGDIFMAEKTKTGWGNITELPENINRFPWTCVTLIAPNGQALLLEASEDYWFGGGDIDLFVSLKSPAGEWQDPIPLTALNTPKFDRSPFLHPDMKTLYFSSAGRGGNGGMDVFKTTRLDDTWLNWSTPVNLGDSINTTGDDWGYILSTDGSTAYFSAGQPGDLYMVGVPQEMRPEAVSTLKINAVSASGEPVAAEVIVRNESGKVVGELRTDPATGESFITLPAGEVYVVSVEGENHLAQTTTIDLRDTLAAKKEIAKTIEVKTPSELLKSDEKMQLNKLLFDHDKAELRSESNFELDRIARFVLANKLTLTLEGHTDDSGSPEYNLELSEKRAKAVAEYLASKGVPAERITTRGFGETVPFNAGTDEEARAQNRRVEVRFGEVK
ncbi:MAG: OmpA family protein, partial [Bacteroidota bacterium]